MNRIFQAIKVLFVGLPRERTIATLEYQCHALAEQIQQRGKANCRKQAIRDAKKYMTEQLFGSNVAVRSGRRDLQNGDVLYYFEIDIAKPDEKELRG